MSTRSTAAGAPRPGRGTATILHPRSTIPGRHRNDERWARAPSWPATHAGREERVIYGQRVDGVVRVTDRPVQKGGRAYLVDRELENKAELDALVADYTAQARRLGACPMSATAVARLLDGTWDGR